MPRFLCVPFGERWRKKAVSEDFIPAGFPAPFLDSWDDSRKNALIYSPFATKITLLYMICRNADRLDRGKPASPLFVNSERQANYLKMMLSEWIRLSKNSPKAKEDPVISTIRTLVDPDLKPIFRRGDLVSALLPKNVLIYSLERNGLQHLQTGRNKIYIIGHGLPGISYLIDTEEKCGSFFCRYSTLAKNFIAAKLSPDFDDFRLVSCHSGDDKVLRGTTLPPGGQIDRAMAQQLANALAKQGFSHAQVMGYRGQGIVYPGARNGIMRTIFDDKKDSHDVYARHHRHRFLPR